MFDLEYVISVHAMQVKLASFHSEGYVSYDFSSCGRNLAYIRSYRGDGLSKLHLVQRSQDTCEFMRDTSGI